MNMSKAREYMFRNNQQLLWDCVLPQSMNVYYFNAFRTLSLALGTLVACGKRKSFSAITFK